MTTHLVITIQEMVEEVGVMGQEVVEQEVVGQVEEVGVMGQEVVDQEAPMVEEVGVEKEEEGAQARTLPALLAIRLHQLQMMMGTPVAAVLAHIGIADAGTRVVER